MNDMQKRINYQGDLKPLLQQVCKDFNLGSYISYYIIPIGYEDFNLKLKTNKSSYLIKIFASFRDESACKRYVDVMQHVIEAGIAHPALYKSIQGFLYQISLDNTVDRLCVMEYVSGKSFFELQVAPNLNSMRFILKQAALINRIDINPDYIYDNWAVVNFFEQYEMKKSYLTKEDNKLLAPLVTQFKSLRLQDLPHCFVHGDITKTNVIQGNAGELRIVDFAVSNYYPRILELAALFSDFLFDQKNASTFAENFELALKEYQGYIPLSTEEIATLPICVKLTHAMHILCANYEKAILKNTSDENGYYLRTGRVGLELTGKLWP